MIYINDPWSNKDKSTLSLNAALNILDEVSIEFTLFFPKLEPSSISSVSHSDKCDVNNLIFAGTNG